MKKLVVSLLLAGVLLTGIGGQAGATAIDDSSVSAADETDSSQASSEESSGVDDSSQASSEESSGVDASIGDSGVSDDLEEGYDGTAEDSVPYEKNKKVDKLISGGLSKDWNDGVVISLEKGAAKFRVQSDVTVGLYRKGKGFVPISILDHVNGDYAIVPRLEGDMRLELPAYSDYRAEMIPMSKLAGGGFTIYVLEGWTEEDIKKEGEFFLVFFNADGEPVGYLDATKGYDSIVGTSAEVTEVKEETKESKKDKIAISQKLQDDYVTMDVTAKFELGSESGVLYSARVRYQEVTQEREDAIGESADIAYDRSVMEEYMIDVIDCESGEFTFPLYNGKYVLELYTTEGKTVTKKFTVKGCLSRTAAQVKIDKENAAKPPKITFGTFKGGVTGLDAGIKMYSNKPTIMKFNGQVSDGYVTEWEFYLSENGTYSWSAETKQGGVSTGSKKITSFESPVAMSGNASPVGVEYVEYDPNDYTLPQTGMVAYALSMLVGLASALFGVFLYKRKGVKSNEE